jgi:hypothetical protein
MRTQANTRAALDAAIPRLLHIMHHYRRAIERDRWA